MLRGGAAVLVTDHESSLFEFRFQKKRSNTPAKNKPWLMAAAQSAHLFCRTRLISELVSTFDNNLFRQSFLLNTKLRREPPALDYGAVKHAGVAGAAHDENSDDLDFEAKVTRS